jgi:hypothetical protein
VVVEWHLVKVVVAVEPKVVKAHKVKHKEVKKVVSVKKVEHKKVEHKKVAVVKKKVVDLNSKTDIFYYIKTLKYLRVFFLYLLKWKNKTLLG